VAEACGELVNLAVEVHLVPMTFRGNKFPYGTMRNTLMQSEATRSLVRRFAEQGWAPICRFKTSTPVRALWKAASISSKASMPCWHKTRTGVCCAR
ncbi:hypothetical protein, partial [Aeromonas sp. HMWF014]|uniref:hypothetical protein n=1 Tax=Aeromonas sp. HMWF014 TaxID=2056850 RepID=UPI001C6262D7